MRQAHTRSGRLRECVEDIVSADGNIGLSCAEPLMGGMLTASVSSKMAEVTFAP